MRKPDLFVVGAPKCGTTALHEYLGQHPDIFMSPVKEPTYFGSDLVRLRKPIDSLEAYLALFSGASHARRVGESSTAYLRSRRAAVEIGHFNPASRIIAMVRNPIDVMHAFHSQLLYQGEEEIEDFEQALAAEPARKSMIEDPGRSRFAESVLYRNVVRFADQLERYLDRFGEDRVHVIVHDDLLRDTAGEYEKVLRFLEVDPAPWFVSFEIVNPNKAIRSRWLHRLLVHPPRSARTVVTAVLPERARAFAFGSVRRLNTAHAPRIPVSPELRRQLVGELAPEVDRLGALIGRDLSQWTKA